MYSTQMKQILNQCKGEKRMDKTMNLKAIKALKELRNAMYDSLTEEEKKEADEKEIEYGANKVAEMFCEMHPMSVACILKSVIEKNPKILIDINNFGDFIDKSFDIFGAEKTAKMISVAMTKIEDDLKKKLEEEFLVNRKLKEMNGEPEEKEEPKEDTPDELHDIIKLLKAKGWDVELEKIEEVEDD